MTSWCVFKIKKNLCSIKIFNFAEIIEIFTNITKVIYLDLNKNTIMSKPLVKLSINIAKFHRISELSTIKMPISAKFE